MYHNKAQSNFLRHFPKVDMAHMARVGIKPITTGIHHISPLLSLFGGHGGKVLTAVSGIVDKLV